MKEADMTNNIRAVTPDDLTALKAVIEGTGLFPSELLDDMIASYFEEEEDSGEWLTYDDGGAVAVAYYTAERMTEGTYNALLLAVHPNHQSKGLGAALMRHTEQTLKEQGARVLLVETSGLTDFERTRDFYRKIGYEEEARIREFYAKGEDKIVFRKAL